jgi:hypothetical protein
MGRFIHSIAVAVEEFELYGEQMIWLDMAKSVEVSHRGWWIATIARSYDNYPQHEKFVKTIAQLVGKAAVVVPNVDDDIEELEPDLDQTADKQKGKAIAPSARR